MSRKKKAADTDQGEFVFVETSAQRGYFEKTDRNLYQEEDLDVPTFMRRGIKIKMRVKLAAKLLVIAWSIMKTKNAFDPALFQSVK